MQYPVIESKYTGIVPIIGFASAAGFTTIGTPPPNSDLRMIVIGVTEQATTGTAGEYPISIHLNSVEFYTENIYLGGTGGGNAGTLFEQTLMFHSLNLSSGASGSLEVELTNALTSGKIQINAYFD